MRTSLAGYRRLLKSASLLFREDHFALVNAKSELKSEFLKNKSVTSAEDLKALLRGIEEVDEMLRFNVVQGKLNKNGNYGVGFTEEHFVTIEAGQSDPNGPVLSNPDSSLTGSVKVEKSCAGKKT